MQFEWLSGQNSGNKNMSLNDLGKSSEHNISTFGWQFTEVAAFLQNRVSELKLVFVFPSGRDVRFRILGENFEPERTHPTQQIWLPPLRSACGHYLLTPCSPFDFIDQTNGINQSTTCNSYKKRERE
jgi:hypothetical protein